MNEPTTEQVTALAVAYLSAQGESPKLTDEGIVLDGGRVFGIEPLRRRLAVMESVDWPGAVVRHFRTLLQVKPDFPTTWEEARAKVRLAVIPEPDLGMFDGALFEQPLYAGLGQRLMVRAGDLGMTVTREVVAAWEAPEQAVWEQAKRNALLDEPYAVETFDGYWAIRGGRWTSSRVLDLEEVIGHDVTFGALVAVPARDEILIHPVRDIGFIEASVRMLSHLASSYMESPLPMTLDLYWYSPTDHELHVIATVEDGQYRYTQVREFSRLLWTLERQEQTRQSN